MLTRENNAYIRQSCKPSSKIYKQSIKILKFTFISNIKSPGLSANRNSSHYSNIARNNMNRRIHCVGHPNTYHSPHHRGCQCARCTLNDDPFERHCGDYSESDSTSGESEQSDCGEVYEYTTSNRGRQLRECVLHVFILSCRDERDVLLRERDICNTEILGRVRIHLTGSTSRNFLIAKIKSKIRKSFPNYCGSFRFVPVLGCEVESVTEDRSHSPRNLVRINEPRIYIRLTKPLRRGHTTGTPQRLIGHIRHITPPRRHQHSPSHVRVTPHHNRNTFHSHPQQLENDVRNLQLGLWWIKLIILECEAGYNVVGECDEDNNPHVTNVLMETHLLMNFGDNLCQVLRTKLRSALCILLPGYKGGFSFLAGYKEVLVEVERTVHQLLECPSDEPIPVEDLPVIPRVYIRLSAPLDGF